jgi:hypothetical protein
VEGSLASPLPGEPRATNDIDIVVDLPVARTADLVAALGGDFEVACICRSSSSGP